MRIVQQIKRRSFLQPLPYSDSYRTPTHAINQAPPIARMIFPVPPQFSQRSPLIFPDPEHFGQTSSPVPGVPGGASSPGLAALGSISAMFHASLAVGNPGTRRH
jgi:hypothetical protein